MSKSSKITKKQTSCKSCTEYTVSKRVKELLHAKCFTGSTNFNPLRWASLYTAFKEEAGSEQSGDFTQVTQQEREEVKDMGNREAMDQTNSKAHVGQ